MTAVDVETKLNYFNKLLELDEPINNVVSEFMKLYEVVPELSKIIKGWSLAGSIAEGCCLGRLFFPPEKPDEKINVELEADVNLKIQNFSKSIEDIPGKVGFANIKSKDEKLKDILNSLNILLKEVNDKERTMEDLVDEDGYLKAKEIKKAVDVAVDSHSLLWDFKGILNKLLNTFPSPNLKKDDFTISNPNENKEETKASIASEIEIKYKEKLLFKISWDTVIVYECDKWPAIAADWINRPRNWPKEDTINSIISEPNIIYLIAKLHDEQDTKSFRYSFCEVEKRLSKKWNKHQKLVYFIFKSMIYKELKPINKDEISSFLGKNVMFWIMEEGMMMDEKKMSSNDGKVEAIKHLFLKLREMIAENHAPYYFIPSINLIENMSNIVKQNLMEKIETILSELVNYIPNNVEMVLNKVKPLNEYKDFIKAFIGEYFRGRHHSNLVVENIRMSEETELD